MIFQVFAWLSGAVARIAIHEIVHGSLYMKHFGRCLTPHVMRGVFRALGIVPGYPTYAQFCAESILYLRFSP